MLKLKHITKKYRVGTKVVDALNGITVNFDERELVAVLGPSGCGKTTLMNIIGGLDRATSGELIIGDTVTKHYKDSDWNNYRNHQIGFVFQAYNLIPHMTVFGNVELALTLSGVSSKERKAKVLDALAKVGLSDQAYKKPNQMSGGQMQRVAIARALVNNPKILLADEPTGAVDSKTGIQIMEILKEISRECLVILVTHNQDLACKYASRIISMQDGLIISDEQQTEEVKRDENLTASSLDASQVSKPKSKKKKTKMGFLTAAKLSFNNLLNKKGRSFITVISGAISVICIALILAMNSGFAYYINDFEKNNLSRYPIKVTTQTTSVIDLLNEAFSQGRNFDTSNVSINSMLELFKDDAELREKYTDIELVYLSKLILGVIETGISGFQNLEDFEFENEFDVLSELFGISLGTDIVEFMKSIETGFHPEWGAIMRNYNLDFDIYSKNDEGVESKLNPVDIFISFVENSGLLGILNLYPGDMGSQINSLLYGEDMDNLRQMFDNNNPWAMMIDDASLLDMQYEVLAGRLPDFGNDKAKNEIVLVVDEFNQLDDFTLFLLGVVSVESFILSVINEFIPLLPPGAEEMVDYFLDLLLPPDTEEMREEYDFREFVGGDGNMPATFVLRTPTDYFALDEETGLYNKLGEGEEVEVVGILRLRSGVSAGVISGAIGYTEALATTLIEKANNAPVVLALKDALEEYNGQREMLMSFAQKLINLDFDISSISQISPTPRMIILEQILSLSGDINIKSQQITLLTEIADLLDGFEFTPENRVVINQFITLYQSLNIPEESYDLLFEAITLLNQLDTNNDNISLLIQAGTLLSGLEVSEENANTLIRAGELLSELEITQENIDILIETATLLNSINPSEETIVALIQIAELMGEINQSTENIAVMAEIATLLGELTVSEEDIETVIQIMQILGRLDFESEDDAQTLGQIFELSSQLIASPDDAELWLQMWNLIDLLTSANAEIMEEAIPLILSLGLTPADIAIIREAAILTAGLNISPENIAVMVEVGRILRNIELSEENLEVFMLSAQTMSELELSEGDAQILMETVMVLSELELTESDIKTLTQAGGILAQVEVSEGDRQILWQVAKVLSQLEISEEDAQILIQMVEVMGEINLDSSDMIALREVLGLTIELLSTVEEEDEVLMWEIISLIDELDLTSADMENIDKVLSLTEQIDLTAEEQEVIEELLSLMEAFEIADTETLRRIIDLTYQIKLSKGEQEVIWETLELVMQILEFAPDDIENVLALAQSIIDLDIEREEIDFLIDISPALAKIDFSRSEGEIMNQLGGVFKIRNVVVAEDSACNHSPHIPHNKDCAWFDTVQYNALMNSFDLRDVMRPDSVHIYPFSIESRNAVLKFINDFNIWVQNNEELSGSTIDYSVVYTDELSEMTASMSSMINTITYILIGVAAIAVIVAMLLVAIILYISVQDRTKEIGLLRSLGASKSNVSSVFIAETFIIGLVSGIVGVCLALVLIIPANSIINSLMGISNLLRPVWWHQFALVGVAFATTVFSGLIPAALAAKKDPVLALRTD